MSLVIFDFDSTITKKDTFRHFAVYVAQQQKSYFSLILFYVALIMYRARLINDKSLKEFFLKIFFKGMKELEANNISTSFFKDRLPSMIDQEVLSTLQKHVSSEDKVFIASANYDFFLYPLIQEWNLKGIISTTTEKINGKITGNIVGNTCKGKDKVRQIKEHFKIDSIEHVIAYADEEDSCLLASVGKGIKIER